MRWTTSIATALLLLTFPMRVLADGSFTVWGDYHLSASASLTIDGGVGRIAGDFDVAINDYHRFNVSNGAIQFIGFPNAGPYDVEVLASNNGPCGVTLPNLPLFSIGQLHIGPSNIRVRLVDNHDNSSGPGDEALYVDLLFFEAGTRLDLAGLNLYYNTLFPANAGQPGSGITITDTVGGGSLMQFGAGGPNPPTAPVADPASVCAGDEVELSATVDPGLEVDWYTGICGGSFVGTGNPLTGVMPAMTTTYRARARDPNTECVSASCASVIVTVNANPTCSITTDSAVCAGGTGLTATVADAGPGAAYDWFVTGGSITAGQNTPLMTYSAGGGPTVTIDVTVTNALGCEESCQAIVATEQSLWIGPNGGSFVTPSYWDPAGVPTSGAVLQNTTMVNNRSILSASGQTSVCSLSVSSTTANKQFLQVIFPAEANTTDGGSVGSNGEIELRDGLISGGAISVAPGGVVSGYGEVAADLLIQGMVRGTSGRSLILSGDAFENQAGGTLLAPTSADVILQSASATQGGLIDIRGLAAVVLDAALTNLAGGSIMLTGGVLSAAEITNETLGNIEGFGQIDCDLNNDGEMVLIADTQVAGDLDNEGTITIQSGILTVSGTLSGGGAIIGDFFGRGGNEGVTAIGDLVLDGSARLAMNGGKLRVARDFNVAISDAERFDMVDASVQLVGLPRHGVQLLEAMGGDIGACITAPPVPARFPIGSLHIGPTATTVRVVDNHDNATGAGPEAVYALNLVLFPGTTLDLAGVTVYYETVSPPDPFAPGSGVTVIDSVGGGGLVVLSSGTAPTISVQPDDLNVCIGDIATFSLTADGSPTPTYQWRRNGMPLIDGGNISGATTDTLVIDPAAPADAGDYDCVVSNACDAIPSDLVQLMVAQPPVVDAGPDATICQIDTFELSGATSSYHASVEWATDGDGMFDAPDSVNPTYTPGPNDVAMGSVQLTLTAHPVAPCSGDVDNSMTLFIVADQPVVDAGDDADVCATDTFALDAATAMNYDSLTWSTGGDGMFDDASALNPIYTLGSGDIAAGSVELTLTADPSAPCLTAVADSLILSVVLAPQADAGPDDAVCDATSYDLADASAGDYDFLEWSTAGDGTFDDSGAVNPTYTPGLDDIDAGSVELTLTAHPLAPCSVPAISTVTLTLNRTPVFTLQPLSQEGVVGLPVIFTVTMSANPSPTYQWRRNGMNLVDGPRISGATTATLTIDPVAAADAGDYDVRVTNLCGQDISDVATLTTRLPHAELHLVSTEALPGEDECLQLGGGGEGTLTVRVEMRNAEVPVVGAQFFIEFSTTALDFVQAVPGDDPFTREVFEFVDEDAGTITYAIGIENTGAATQMDKTMAVLTFVAAGDDCGENALVRFSDGSQTLPPTRLSDANHGAVDAILYELPPTRIDITEPIVLAPSDVSLNSDAGTCEVVLNPPPEAIAYDTCDLDVALTFTRSDGKPNLSDSFEAADSPIVISWLAEDDCGNTGTAVQVVTVSSFNEVVVDVELSPALDPVGTVDRCIRFDAWQCPSDVAPRATADQVITFPALGGGLPNLTQSVSVLLPCGDYTCLTARDILHTLRSTAPDFADEGASYRATFVGNRATGGHWLVLGNLNDDRFVDILDFGSFVIQFQRNYGTGQTDCSTPFFHADLSGDGLVFTADFTFIQINFVKRHENNCCGRPGMEEESSEPITSIAVDELWRMGLGELAGADLNGDGALDAADMTAFADEAGVSDWPNDSIMLDRPADGRTIGRGKSQK